jgi:hypothetical protein
MRKIRSRFSGEIIEYASIPISGSKDGESKTA